MTQDTGVAREAMSTTYMILGAGMQGTAAAYDLARFAAPGRLILADRDPSVARASAERVNRLAGTTVAEGVALDALDPSALAASLHGVDVLLSCVPYWMHPGVAAAAIASRTSMLDLGGNLDVTRRTLALDGDAKAAGITLVPDCGLAPGLVNSLALALLERFDAPESVRLYCGVLPQNPRPPFGYKLTFNVEGLVSEYDYEGAILRDGELASIPTLTELETVEDTPLGTLEAFVTSGGVSTAPETFRDLYGGTLRTYEYKTFRFPGHCERMRLYKDFGLWREDEVEVATACGPVRVRPKDVFVRVFGEELAKVEDRDQCVIRAVGEGVKAGARASARIEIHDREDEATGFTSMERLTGFSLAIHAAWVAAGEIPQGAVRYERATKGAAFIEALRKRGVGIATGWD